MSDAAHLFIDPQIQLSGVADHLAVGLHGRLFFGISCAQCDHADGAFHVVHDSFLDLQRDTHDFLDAIARSQRIGQPGPVSYTHLTLPTT